MTDDNGGEEVAVEETAELAPLEMGIVATDEPHDQVELQLVIRLSPATAMKMVESLVKMLDTIRERKKIVRIH